jgi:hypothetical protein
LSETLRRLPTSGVVAPSSPYEPSQVPLFRVLGTPPDQKRHLVFPGGHSSFGWTNELIKEGLDWLDRWFGPPVR